MIGSSPLNSLFLLTLTILLFFIIPPTASPFLTSSSLLPFLTSSSLLPLLPSSAPGGCFRTWSQKARWVDFALYIDSHCSSPNEYFSLSSAAASYLFGTECGQIFDSFLQRHRRPQTWLSSEVEEAVRKRREAFASAHRSDKEQHAYISAARHGLSIIVQSRGKDMLISLF